jgi:hypothetical protein
MKSTSGQNMKDSNILFSLLKQLHSLGFQLYSIQYNIWEKMFYLLSIFIFLIANVFILYY